MSQHRLLHRPGLAVAAQLSISVLLSVYRASMSQGYRLLASLWFAVEEEKDEEAEA